MYFFLLGKHLGVEKLDHTVSMCVKLHKKLPMAMYVNSSRSSSLEIPLLQNLGCPKEPIIAPSGGEPGCWVAGVLQEPKVLLQGGVWLIWVTPSGNQ